MIRPVARLPAARIDVVVPAHDEERLVGASLDALARARAELRRRAARLHAPVELGIVVVLDACTDRTTSEVERAISRSRADGATDDRATDDRSADDRETSGASADDDVAVIAISERNVGAARRAGAAAALAVPTAVAPDRRWIATTDADSRVHPDWLVVQLEALLSGVDVLLGTVRPDAADLDDEGWRRWLEAHPPGHLPGNVHGANLGVGVAAYERLGGFATLAEHEDVDLVARARTAGLDVRATDRAPVVTSGRRVGRTPGGYAAFIAATYGDHPDAALC